MSLYVKIMTFLKIDMYSISKKKADSCFASLLCGAPSIGGYARNGTPHLRYVFRVAKQRSLAPHSQGEPL